MNGFFIFPAFIFNGFFVLIYRLHYSFINFHLMISFILLVDGVISVVNLSDVLR